MPLTITQRTRSRITAHGLNVYPLEGFGLLLGDESVEHENGNVLAALPVGKTQRWYDPAGRFARIDEAFSVATNLFSDWKLRPIGFYCTVYNSFGAYPDNLIATAPQVPDAPWLLLRGVDGGETIFGCWAMRWDAGQWHDESFFCVSAKVDAPERNPRRIAVRWNRSWGVLDYGNLHELELPRLGLIRHVP